MLETMRSLFIRKNCIFPILPFFLLFSACSKSTDSKINIDLLSTALNNPKPLALEAFNTQLIDAAASEDEWAKEPTMILHAFVGTSSGRNVILTVNKLDVEGPQNIYKSIVIFDDIADDDSIRGYRYDVRLGQNEQDVWQIIEASKSWRCRENRGHTDFSSENCA